MSVTRDIYIYIQNRCFTTDTEQVKLSVLHDTFSLSNQSLYQQ